MRSEERPNISKLLKGFEHVCRAKGLRITHQRSGIFRELARFPGHPTAENVFKQVRKRLKTISLDTVYRTIATFENYGLIKRIQILDNAARYDINLTVHHHLVCIKCKRIEDFYWPDFDNMKLPKAVKGWKKIDSRHAEILGVCRYCAPKRKRK